MRFVRLGRALPACVVAGGSVMLVGGLAVSVQAQTVLPSVAAASSDACNQTAPCITPSTDADVLYELASPTGDATMKQRMRWQVASLRQRLDPENSSVFMVTSWPEHTLSVVDVPRHKQSTMPAPSQNLTPPGHPAMIGTYARLGSSIVAGESCTVWRTKDTDGHANDVCYTSDGLLLQVAQGQQITVRALSVSRSPQPDSVFAIPAGLRQEAPATP